MSSILLSPKHGVNPTIPCCFFCGKQKNEIVLTGRRSKRNERGRVVDNDVAMPMSGLVFNREPCDECRKLMELGVILISVDESKSDDLANPYRTGGWAVVKDVALKSVQPKSLRDYILAKRVAFVPDDAWDKLGLPRPVKE